MLKITSTISVELVGKLVDLDWLARLTARVGELAVELGREIAALSKMAAELPHLLASIRWVRHLAERVVHGGRVLLGFVRRALQSGKRSLDAHSVAPGSIFRDIDDPWCPELVAIRAGWFVMGSPDHEEGRSEDEGPRHKVQFAKPFALGRCPVTFDEYDEFCRSTGRRRPKDEGFGVGRHPVINVSWHDARAYCNWLAERTGQPYRLPSEAEWEYACRAGTDAPYTWGDVPAQSKANFGGRVGGTSEVGSFPPNSWGLFDMHGNVWEWVEDCWRNDYSGVPSDGSPWVDKSCRHRVLRGGSWINNARNLRSAERDGGIPEDCFDDAGFRVARTLQL